MLALGNRDPGSQVHPHSSFLDKIGFAEAPEFGTQGQAVSSELRGQGIDFIGRDAKIMVDEEGAQDTFFLAGPAFAMIIVPCFLLHA